MVYRVSKKFILHRFFEPFFIALFWPVLFFFVSNTLHYELDDRSYDLSIQFVMGSFFIIMLLSLLRIHICHHSVLVVDQHGILVRYKTKVERFEWQEINKIVIRKRGNKLTRIVLEPVAKEINVSFMHSVEHLAQDVEYHSQSSSVRLVECK